MGTNMGTNMGTFNFGVQIWVQKINSLYVK